MSFLSGTRPGFEEDVITGPSSSSPPHKGGLLPLYTHHHHHHHHEEPDQDSNDQMRRGTLEGSSISSTRSASHHHEVVIEREHMFDKVVTPSDVGKLNRLVIPKQHAEKYFPLDSSKAGLLLNFEDRNGKPWGFRYSYWNSSQSYVMTKGWSRFVKDKKLDAGDIVSFQRGVGESAKDRLFIDWRHRPSIPHQLLFPWNLHPPPPLISSNIYPTIYGSYPSSGNPFCPPGREEVHERMVFNSVPVLQGKVAAKRLRLFGVTMDCPISESDDDTTMQIHHLPPPGHFHSLSSSLQLMPYNKNDIHKGDGSMSLDLDI